MIGRKSPGGIDSALLNAAENEARRPMCTLFTFSGSASGSRTSPIHPNEIIP